MSSEIERILYGNRTILARDAHGEQTDGWADVAYEAVRAMNHITIGYGRTPIPAPVAYRVLGNLAGLAHMLPQLSGQLAGGLQESLTSPDFAVYDNKGDSAASVAEAVEHLTHAAHLANELGAALAAAQVAINGQGYELADRGSRGD